MERRKSAQNEVSRVAKYKIVVDRGKCLGDKQCWDLAPETFCIDDDDKSYVCDPAGNWPEYILKAAKACPADAIKLYDAETRFRALAARGSLKKGLRVLDKLDDALGRVDSR